eukprot:366393-Chlamydomonas_euryale.AAC.7
MPLHFQIFCWPRPRPPPPTVTCVATLAMLLMRLLAVGSTASTPSDSLDPLDSDTRLTKRVRDRVWARHVGDGSASDGSTVTGGTMNKERWVPFTIQSNPGSGGKHGPAVVKGLTISLYTI